MSDGDWAGRSLLIEAQRLLDDELAERLDGKDRFLARMIANALSVVEREGALGSKSTAAEKSALERTLRQRGDLELLRGALKEALRAGRFDGQPELYKRLIKMSEARVAITNPKALEH